MEAELVEGPESIRAKAHRADTPIRPARNVSRMPSRTIKGLPTRLAECGKIKIGGKGASRPTKSGGTFRLPEKHE